MTRYRKTFDQALPCACITALAFGGTAAWS